MKATVHYHDLTDDPNDLPAKPRRWRQIETVGGHACARVANAIGGPKPERAVWETPERIVLADGDVLGWWSLPKLEEEA